MTEAVTATSARVSDFLEELGVSKLGPSTFVAKRGSAVVGIHVMPFAGEEDGAADALVQIQANVVEGANLTVDVLRQLLEFNHEAAYGGFGLGEKGLVTYHHCLLGSSLAKTELIDVLYEVAKVADDWDDILVEQAGGVTAIDKLRELNKPKIQPTIEGPAKTAEGE